MRFERWFTAIVAAAPLCALAIGVARAADPAPPDLSGTWTNAWLTKTERAKDFSTLSIPEAQAQAYDRKNANKVKLPTDPVGQEDSEWPEAGDRLARIRGTVRTSWIYDPADGKIPYTPAAKVLNKTNMENGEKRFDNPEERPPNERCLGTGQPGPPLRNAADLNVYEILQTKDHVVLVSEGNQTPRIIRIGAKPTGLRQWMGDSVGRWEGRTLVVETVNFHPAQFRGPDGKPTATRVTERFTRSARDEIHYQFEVENPAIYTQRWRGEMVLRPSKGRFFEYACHEGNYALENILRGGRVAETKDGSAEVGAR